MARQTTQLIICIDTDRDLLDCGFERQVRLIDPRTHAEVGTSKIGLSEKAAIYDAVVDFYRRGGFRNSTPPLLSDDNSELSSLEAGLPPEDDDNSQLTESGD